jgi:hypothetical protein
VKKRVILFAAAAAVLLGLLLVRSLLPGRAARVPFDAERWCNLGPIDFGDLRLAMAQDLVSSKRLVGMHRAEVRALLCEPTYHEEHSGDWGYELYEEHRGGNIDPTDGEDLVVKFDSDDRAIEARNRIWHSGDR